MNNGFYERRSRMENDNDLKCLLDQLKINYNSSELESSFSISPSSSSSTFPFSSSSASSDSPSSLSSIFDILLFITTEDNKITDKSLTECIEYYSTQLRNWGKLKRKNRKMMINSNSEKTRLRRKTY